jgi:hypothetical protein
MTHTLSRIVRMRVMCMMELVNARVMMKNIVDRDKPAAAMKSRRYTVCLEKVISLIPIWIGCRVPVQRNGRPSTISKTTSQTALGYPS